MPRQMTLGRVMMGSGRGASRDSGTAPVKPRSQRTTMGHAGSRELIRTSVFFRASHCSAVRSRKTFFISHSKRGMPGESLTLLADNEGGNVGDRNMVSTEACDAVLEGIAGDDGHAILAFGHLGGHGEYGTAWPSKGRWRILGAASWPRRHRCLHG